MVSLLIQTGICTEGFALIKRHLVIYGGLNSADLSVVAKNAEIVILNNVPREHLVRLKQINPRMLLFQYHHSPGFHSHYHDWESVDAREDWFVHDKNTGERLVEKKYGWFLMNISSESWRNYLATRIASITDDIFDGVFLDDAWVRFSNKFRCQISNSTGQPKEDFAADWAGHMQQLIATVRHKYPKRIFINGAHEEYIHLVDGCMEENFVHPNWKPGYDLPDPSTYLRMLRKMERIQNYGKALLIQSGTSGADPDSTRKIFDYCLASYHLIEGPNTSFGFHRAPTYRYQGPLHSEDVHPYIGEPTAPFRIVKQTPHRPNLVVNNTFEKGWRHWRVMQGRPQIETEPSLQAGISAVTFSSRESGSDQIASDFIPVRDNFRYRLAAVCKAHRNRAGSRRYQKLGLQGRFYSIDRKQLPGAYDLQFEEGTYDWLPFETSFISPPGAAFFRIRIGFIGDGTGKGAVSQVFFGPAADRAVVVGRSFTRAEVLVNSGTDEATVSVGVTPIQKPQSITLKPAGAIVISIGTDESHKAQ